MKRAGRIALWVAAGAALAILVLVLAVGVLTRTELGQERVRRFTIGWLEDRVEGRLQIGALSSEPGLLAGVTLHDLSLSDPQGRPVLEADSATLRYDWRTLVGGAVVLDEVILWSPRLLIERLPGSDSWNYERAIEGPEEEEAEQPGPGSLVLLQGLAVHDGHIEVRFPWEPDEGERVEPADTARLILERAPGGLVRVLRFEEVDAVVPRLLVESPDQEGRLFRIASLSTRGYIWEEPVHVRELEGTLTLRDSIVSFEADRVRLPSSRASIVGEVIVGEDDIRMDVRIEGDTVALADIQWVYPGLPEQGGGSVVFRMQSQEGGGTLWYAEELELSTPGTRLAGSFGVVTGDTLYFTRVQLRASPLDVQLLRDILPVELPVDGLLVGTVEVDGPLSALRARGDVRFAQRLPRERAPPRPPGPSLVGAAAVPRARAPVTRSSSIRWSGTFDVSRRPARIRTITADVDRLEPALVEALRPELVLPEGLSGHLQLSEHGRDGLRLSGLVRRARPGLPELRVRVEGAVAGLGREPTLDLRLSPDGMPLSALLPSLDSLRGQVDGTVQLTGPLDDLRVTAELATTGGPVSVDAVVDLTGDSPRYRGVVQLTGFRAAAVLPRMPPTELTGRVQVDGVGTRPEDADVAIRARLEGTRIGALDLREAELRLGIADGVLTVDTLTARADAGRLGASGRLGLSEGRDGTIQWRMEADSLAALRSFLFPDTVLLGPNEEGARLAGRLRADGTLRGRLGSLDVRAEIRGQDLLVDEAQTPGLEAEVTASALGSAEGAWHVSGRFQQLDLYGARLTGALVTVGEDPTGGRLTVLAGAPGGRGYQVESRFRRDEEALTLLVDVLSLRSRRATWSLSAPTEATWGPDGLRLGGFELVRDGGSGRIAAAGILPLGAAPEVVADFGIVVEGVRIAEFLDLAQSELEAEGVMTGRLDIQGRAGDPRIELDLTASRLGVEAMRLDRGYFVTTYADRHLEGRVEARHGDRTVLSATALVPVDLALSAVDERRIPEPLQAQIRADSLPVALVTSLLDGFHEVDGSVSGEVTIGGTTRDPQLDGLFRVADGSLAWEATGVRYRGVDGTIRLSGRNSVDVAARLLTAAGGAELNGSLTFRELRNPAFDLDLSAASFEFARRKDVELAGSAALHLGGSFRQPVVRGRLAASSGALNLDEIWRTSQVVELDEDLLFAVVDTSIVSVRGILPASQSPFLKNLVVDATAVVGRDVWLRSRQMNVEITGELDIDFDRRVEDLRMTGTLTALRGLYQLYGRRFEVQDGQVEFFGTPGIDPNLRITAVYRARDANNEPLDIQAVVSGTLLAPRVALVSDAEPPISESDLVSYLVFGRPTYALANAEAQQLGLGRFGALGVGAVGPSLIGLAGTNLETFAQTLGFADYLAITADELAAGAPSELGGLGGLLPAARFTLGWYLSDDVFFALSQRVAGGTDVQQPALRMEWRFRPTWTLEAFSEDRFASAPSLGLQTGLELQRVYGVFLFREWGY